MEWFSWDLSLNLTKTIPFSAACFSINRMMFIFREFTQQPTFAECAGNEFGPTEDELDTAEPTEDELGAAEPTEDELGAAEPAEDGQERVGIATDCSFRCTSIVWSTGESKQCIKADILWCSTGIGGFRTFDDSAITTFFQQKCVCSPSKGWSGIFNSWSKNAHRPSSKLGWWADNARELYPQKWSWMVRETEN